VRTCYGEDLAHVHAAGFGAFAESVAAYLLTRFQSSSVPIRRIIDIGCGAGVTTRAFSDAGFSVLGVEPSEPLIERARKASPGAEFVQASAYDIALPACEAIVAVGEVLTYHDDLDRADDRVREFFRSAHAALAPGGLLAFDVIATGEPSLTGKSWVSGEDWAVLVQVTEDPSNRSLTREIETFRACSGHYRRSRESHSVRLFDPEEIRAWLSELGFAVEMQHAYGDYRLLPRRVAAIAQRL